MECEKCKQQINPDNKRVHHGQIICEDCYIDTLSPAKACDPWAVFCARSIPENKGAKSDLTMTQKEILEILKETGGISLEKMAKKLQVDKIDLERDVAALRHMEKLKAQLRQGNKIICLW
ncbi:MAG: hypothetical protein HOJ48_02790 [Desulfobacula sp.]|jgi:hypothetical protein|nr:hypothetical protein [Desulfobacula sp.]